MLFSYFMKTESLNVCICSGKEDDGAVRRSVCCCQITAKNLVYKLTLWLCCFPLSDSRVGISDGTEVHASTSSITGTTYSLSVLKPVDTDRLLLSFCVFLFCSCMCPGWLHSLKFSLHWFLWASMPVCIVVLLWHTEFTVGQLLQG